MTSDVLTLAVKGCLGGTFVVAFAVLSEVLRPKSFGGIFDNLERLGATFPEIG